VKKWLYAAAGLLVLFGLGILGGPARAQKKAEGQRDDLILDGSGRAKAKAHKKNIVADKHQRNAVVAGEAGKKVMDKVGTKNESMADLLDSWRKPDPPSV
jgi:hypothetical protein